MLWILDNCYVAPKTNPTTEEANRAVQDKKNLLNSAAAYAEEVSNTDVTINELNLLTDDDIDAVQQIAVWYYTNPEGDPYHVTSIDFWLNSVQGTENSTFKSMINFGIEQMLAKHYLITWYKLHKKQISHILLIIVT